MKAFETGVITKEEFLKEIYWHRDRDNFIKGTYFENGKGCAVSCSLESVARKKDIIINFSDHKQYENLLGIPEWLARLEDMFFENLKNSSKWVVEFSEAINVGADLNKIKTPYIVYLMQENLKTLDSLVIDKKKTQRCF